jgi:hypothetical protein
MWAYKGFLFREDNSELETQWQEKGKSYGILPFLCEALPRWKSLTIVWSCMLFQLD